MTVGLRQLDIEKYDNNECQGTKDDIIYKIDDIPPWYALFIRYDKKDYPVNQ